MDLIEFIVSALNTQVAQTLRTCGYAGAGASLAAILFTSINWHVFAVTLFALLVHMMTVMVWSALIAIGTSISGDVFNSVLSVTTGLMLYGAAVGFYGVIKQWKDTKLLS